MGLVERSRIAWATSMHHATSSLNGVVSKSKVLQAEAKIPQPPSLFFPPALLDFHLSPNEMVFEMSIQRTQIDQYYFPLLIRLYVTHRDWICTLRSEYIITGFDHMSCS